MKENDGLEIGKDLILPDVRHVGMVAPNTPGLLEALRTTLGIREFKEFKPSYQNRRYKGKPGDFELQIWFGNTGSSQFEVIETLHGRTPFQDFFEANGKGMHHVCYAVKDLDRWIEAYAKLGLEVIYSGERPAMQGNPGVKFAYVDNGYFCIELAEFVE